MKKLDFSMFKGAVASSKAPSAPKGDLVEGEFLLVVSDSSSVAYPVGSTGEDALFVEGSHQKGIFFFFFCHLLKDEDGNFHATNLEAPQRENSFVWGQDFYRPDNRLPSSLKIEKGNVGRSIRFRSEYQAKFGENMAWFNENFQWHQKGDFDGASQEWLKKHFWDEVFSEMQPASNGDFETEINCLKIIIEETEKFFTVRAKINKEHPLAWTVRKSFFFSVKKCSEVFFQKEETQVLQSEEAQVLQSFTPANNSNWRDEWDDGCWRDEW